MNTVQFERRLSVLVCEPKLQTFANSSLHFNYSKKNFLLLYPLVDKDQYDGYEFIYVLFTCYSCFCFCFYLIVQNLWVANVANYSFQNH